MAPVAMRGHAAMHAVEAVREAQEIRGRFRRAADAGELSDVHGIDAHLIEALDDALGNGVVPATGAQRGLAAFIIDNLQAEAIDLLGRGTPRWCS